MQLVVLFPTGAKVTLDQTFLMNSTSGSTSRGQSSSPISLLHRPLDQNGRNLSEKVIYNSKRSEADAATIIFLLCRLHFWPVLCTLDGHPEPSGFKSYKCGLKTM